LPTGRVHDWPLQGICCAPLVEGDRLWYVTSRGEVVCLDAEGFYDGEDDGPAQRVSGRLFDIRPPKASGTDELTPALEGLRAGKITPQLRQRFAAAGIELPGTAKMQTVEEGRKWSWQAAVGDVQRDFTAEWMEGSNPTERMLSVYQTITPADLQEADLIWKLDMMQQLQVRQHNMCSCSVTALGDILFVNTSNGVDESDSEVAAPEAPSFLALDKRTGAIVWTDKSPGANIQHGQWSSPAAGVLGEVPQVIFAGGDGWVYSFRAAAGKDGQPELLWKFDANLKESKWVVGGAGTRNNIIATPVIHDGLVYVAVGEDPEAGSGTGHLWCIDPTKRGDVSPTLAVRANDHTHILPPRRVQAVIPGDGEAAIANPNSAVVWEYCQVDRNSDGDIEFEEELHRCCGTPVIQNNLLVVADFGGLVHCLNAKNGQVHWTYDLMSAAWGSPLIVDNHIYIGDEDGDICVFNLTAEKHEPVSEINMGGSVYSTPIVANGVLYIATRTHLFAIQATQP
jgi:outer membrane protein assembly factor BamB